MRMLGLERVDMGKDKNDRRDQMNTYASEEYY